MEHIDFALVHADDAYLDALGAARPPAATADRLTVELLAWRNAVDAEPIHELVALDLAVATVLASLAQRRQQGCA